MTRVRSLHVVQILAPRRTKIVFESVHRLLAETSPLGLGNVGGHLFEEFQEWTRCGVLRHLSLQLIGHQVGDDLRLRQSALDRLVQDCDVLVHIGRDRMQSRNDVVAIFHRKGGHAIDGQINPRMRAIQLSDTKQVSFQVQSIKLRAQVVA